jgi:hypothetical protein
MKQIEKNVIDSFRLAKSDMIKLQSKVIEMSQTQERIVEFIKELKASGIELKQLVKDNKSNKELCKPKTITRTKTVIKKVPVVRTKTIIKKVHTHAKKVYVASKDSKKFHITSCPFAQNIKPKSKIRFKSKVKAFNEGLKPCKCVK